MARFMVAFGGIAGVVGLFLPFARGIERIGDRFHNFSVSLWGAAPTVGIDQIFALVLLGFFLLVGMLGLWAVATHFGRGKALCALGASLPPAAICAYLIAEIASSPSIHLQMGFGLLLPIGGAVLALAGAVAGLVRPDVRAT
jgi:hypothetical protein